ncbi:MAG: SDR family oxidoreductase [candidate division NC10 bacterium]|nr:SDR family oxidoreductase [candidate division NC10 bacterium]
MELGLKGKVAIVTGGSKGLGRAIAMELAREGAKVAICSRGGRELRETAKEIQSRTAGEVLAVVADVTIPEDIEGLVQRTVRKFKRIDILVNNAGRAQPGNLETLTDELLKGDLDVKLFSMVRCSRAVVPYMRKQGGGRIININAVIGRMAVPGFMATITNRGASLAFTKALSDELAKDNILVNSVNIGFVVTPQWENIWKRLGAGLSREDFFQRMADAYVPLRRFGEPEEVSGIVAFLASERASYITGASIDVAGGMGRYV